MKRLTDKQRIVCRGIHGRVGSVHGFAKQYHEDPEQAERDAIVRGEPLAWAIADCGVLSSDKSFYERRAAERATAVELMDGEEVCIDGRQFTVKFVRAGVSDFIHFTQRKLEA